MNRVLAFVFTGVCLLGTLATAEARPARCFTTDDGNFPCDFRPLDRNGSFTVSGRGVPSFTLWVDTPGRGFGSINLGGRDVALPGTYIRRVDDPACWESDATQARICVW